MCAAFLGAVSPADEEAFEEGVAFPSHPQLATAQPHPPVATGLLGRAVGHSGALAEGVLREPEVGEEAVADAGDEVDEAAELARQKARRMATRAPLARGAKDKIRSREWIRLSKSLTMQCDSAHGRLTIPH